MNTLSLNECTVVHICTGQSPDLCPRCYCELCEYFSFLTCVKICSLSQIPEELHQNTENSLSDRGWHVLFLAANLIYYALQNDETKRPVLSTLFLDTEQKAAGYTKKMLLTCGMSLQASGWLTGSEWSHSSGLCFFCGSVYLIVYLVGGLTDLETVVDQILINSKQCGHGILCLPLKPIAPCSNTLMGTVK